MSCRAAATIIAAMSTAPPVLHVIPTPLGSWYVHSAPQSNPLSRHGSATEAEREARRAGAREIHLHDRYGRVHRVHGEGTG